MKRRTALTAIMGCGGVALAGAVGVPAALSAISPSLETDGEPAWRNVGKLEEFAVGRVTKATVRAFRGDWANTLEVKSVYVWRKSEEEFVVFSRNCTDLSCPVTFDQGSECFFCPCHGGIFAKDGEVMAGPPSRPLYRFESRIRDGELEIDLRSLPPMT
ncbi:MAG TPA: ubiquinol-cytochrome c reductase iron-sulfur subunit [Pirellulaceae bacterium]|jgi:menaquinol-cytochrome c reductase iron-sulfur subunit|nr:ubiquinol-cytochrome c reductase iron-sulfur subunit [Pirellulaceae bacterium]